MSLVKLSYIPSDRDIKVSFNTDKETWNDSLGKILSAIKYCANIGASRDLIIPQFYDHKGDSAFRSFVDGDGHFVFRDLKVNNKLIKSKMIKNENGQNSIEVEKV